MRGALPNGPFIVLTCILDVGARPASVTRCHGEAFDRALTATKGQQIANLDIVELPVSSSIHAALRKHLGRPEDDAGVYDLFPLPAQLDPRVRKAAAQFVAAETLWSLDAQGVFGSNSLGVKLDLPRGWDKGPQAVHQKLVESGALDLSPEAIETFRAIKAVWDSHPA